ncbi:hypothetical protein IE53DRAFT_380403 [Violaceomyces palustris]|uniref:Uncharacterized protein n=1 Tax=Violaceomyces palustris TaxID=1673888 RepID=A0ACD0NUX2_9BASI|nr:hypothetical protein IE53DRAFT_380403 [Violaceomyces palustris]
MGKPNRCQVKTLFRTGNEGEEGLDLSGKVIAGAAQALQRHGNQALEFDDKGESQARAGKFPESKLGRALPPSSRHGQGSASEKVEERKAFAKWNRSSPRRKEVPLQMLFIRAFVALLVFPQLATIFTGDKEALSLVGLAQARVLPISEPGRRIRAGRDEQLSVGNFVKSAGKTRRVHDDHLRTKQLPTTVVEDERKRLEPGSKSEGGRGSPSLVERSSPINIVVLKQDQNGQNASRPAPSPRWGHSASYLPSHDVVLFVGGQTDKNGSVTNDVFGLDLSPLSSNASSPDASSSKLWTRLSSEGLPPHAFASSAVTKDSQPDSIERLWVVGGLTENCAVDAPMYMWSTLTGDWRNGTWTTPTVHNAPPRRKGAKAIQVPPSTALGGSNSSSTSDITSFMVLGGVSDKSVCMAENGKKKSLDYHSLDFWSTNSTSFAPGNRSASFTPVQAVPMSVRSLALDKSMSDLSLVDYATVLIPGNPRANPNRPAHSDRVLFLGGRDTSGGIAPFDEFWVLELDTGNWERWNSTGDVPSGRIGHTAVRTTDGKIVVHGGYINGTNSTSTKQKPTNEIFVLDPSVTPAQWSRPSYGNGTTEAPARAFHTAVMANDVMIIGFGEGASSASGQESTGSVEFLHFMDTSNKEAWVWSDSVESLVSSRKKSAKAEASSQAQGVPPAAHPIGEAPDQEPAEVQPQGQAQAQDQNVAENSPAPSSGSTADTSAQKPSSQDAKPISTGGDASSISDSSTQSSPPSQDVGSNQDPAVTTRPADPQAPEEPPSYPMPSDGDSSSTSKGAIAGSVLGAAAAAATIGGLYAYKKRKDAQIHSGNGRGFGGGGGFSDSKFMEDGSRGPPVSSLWLNQPSNWASTATKSIKRAASSAAGLSTPGGKRSMLEDEVRDCDSMIIGIGAATAYNRSRRQKLRDMDTSEGSYTSAPKGTFHVLRNFRGAGSGKVVSREPQTDVVKELPEVDGAHASRLAVNQGTEPKGPRLGCDPAAATAAAASAGTLYAYGRSGSVESLGNSSVGSASHFSYPYLSAMHRPSLANLSTTSSSSLYSRRFERVVVGGVPTSGYATSQESESESEAENLPTRGIARGWSNPHLRIGDGVESLSDPDFSEASQGSPASSNFTLALDFSDATCGAEGQSGKGTISAMANGSICSSPFFPWENVAIQRPPKAVVMEKEETLVTTRSDTDSIDSRIVEEESFGTLPRSSSETLAPHRPAAQLEDEQMAATPLIDSLPRVAELERRLSREQKIKSSIKAQRSLLRVVNH